jgi:hypothetical protein
MAQWYTPLVLATPGVEMDHLSSGVRDQLGQYRETISKKKKITSELVSHTYNPSYLES